MTQPLVATDTILYRVKPGDNINKIINNYFGTVSPQKRKDITLTIISLNSSIKDPNVIHPNQLLQIEIPPRYSASPLASKITPVLNIDKNHLSAMQQQYKAANAKERSMLSALTPIMLGTGAASMTMVDKTFKMNAPLVAKIAELYNDFKANKITKGQYDGRRQKLLNKLKMKLGPTKLLLNGTKPINEVVRISRVKGKKPITNITQQVKRMGKLSRLAFGGGILLSVAGLGVACYEIANTQNVTAKNEILVESLGALGGGLIYGAVVTVLLISTPIGWIAALAIGVGGALTGYGSGKGVKYLYTASGTKVDVTKAMGVNYLCH